MVHYRGVARPTQNIGFMYPVTGVVSPRPVGTWRGSTRADASQRQGGCVGIGEPAAGEGSGEVGRWAGRELSGACHGGRGRPGDERGVGARGVGTRGRRRCAPQRRHSRHGIGRSRRHGGGAHGMLTAAPVADRGWFAARRLRRGEERRRRLCKEMLHALVIHGCLIGVDHQAILVTYEAIRILRTVAAAVAVRAAAAVAVAVIRIVRVFTRRRLLCNRTHLCLGRAQDVISMHLRGEIERLHAREDMNFPLHARVVTRDGRRSLLGTSEEGRGRDVHVIWLQRGKEYASVGLDAAHMARAQSPARRCQRRG